MTTYYRITDGSFHELSVEDYAARAPNKLADLRVWVVDAQPVPTASQVLIDAGIVVGAVEAHQTWGLRDKTAAELDADAQAAEAPAVMAMLAALSDDIQAGAGVAPATQAQAFAQIQALKVRAVRTDRALRWLIKQQS